MMMTRTNMYLLRGVSILGIMLHNYYHLVPGLPKENQFSFSKVNWDHFIDNVLANSFSFIPWCFSFLGHYFVEVFIVSAVMGVVLSNDNGLATFKKRYMSLTKALLLFFLLIGFLQIKTNGFTYYFHDYAPTYLSVLTMIGTFFPYETFPEMGPLWFYCFILQFYLFFPKFFSFFKKYSFRPLLIAVLVIAGLEIFITNKTLVTIINRTPLGYFPIYFLGVYLVTKGKINEFISHWAVGIGGILLFLWSLSTHYLFPLSGFFFCLGLFSFHHKIIWMLTKLKLDKIFYHLGEFSLYFFLAHIIMRSAILGMVLESYPNNSFAISLGALVFLISTYALTLLMRKLLNKAT